MLKFFTGFYWNMFYIIDGTLYQIIINIDP